MNFDRFLVRFWMSHFDKPVMVYPGYEQYTLELVRDLWNNELTPGIIPMQCTGLHDKTTWEELRDAEKRDYLERVPLRTAKEWPGRLIWEGDVVEMSDFQIEKLNGSGLIYWSDDGGQWMYRKSGEGGLPAILHKVSDCLKILGNMYEHPYLLGSPKS